MNEKFEERVKKVNIEFENIKKTKTDTYGHVVIYTAIILAVMFSGYYLGTYAWDIGAISTIGIGMGVLVFAAGPLYKFRNESVIAKNNKEKLDEVLNLYNITHEIDLTYGEKIHGTREVQADLIIKR